MTIQVVAMVAIPALSFNSRAAIQIQGTNNFTITVRQLHHIAVAKLVHSTNLFNLLLPSLNVWCSHLPRLRLPMSSK